MKGNAWVLQLTAQAIARGSAMGSSLFHLQVVIEEAARTAPHTWISTSTVAARIGKDRRTARRLLQEWEEAGYGRRVVEGRGNDLVGIVLFHRLDPKGPAASPEAFAEAVAALKVARGRDPAPHPGTKSSYPSDENDRVPRTESSHRISNAPEQAPRGQALSSGPEGPASPPDCLSAFTRDSAMRAARQCTLIHPRLAKILGRCPDLESRIEGDWTSLTLALAKAETRRNAGKCGEVDSPVHFLIEAARRVREGTDPASGRDRRVAELMDSGRWVRPMPGDEEPVDYREAHAAREWVRERFDALIGSGEPEGPEAAVRAEASERYRGRPDLGWIVDQELKRYVWPEGMFGETMEVAG